MSLLERNTTSKINWALDTLLPPFVRDAEWLWRIIFGLFFGSSARQFLHFKKEAVFLDPEAYARAYSELTGAHIQRQTDLSSKCVRLIAQELKGSTVLDVGCGRGYLADLLSQDAQYQLTGADIVIPDKLRQMEKDNLCFVTAPVEKLPFPDHSFDTVICTHTLEHVPQLAAAIQELRRVAKQRLIVVVPRQREYPYTFDLHVNFFPYHFSLLRFFQRKDATIRCVQNDWVYWEDYSL